MLERLGITLEHRSNADNTVFVRVDMRVTAADRSQFARLFRNDPITDFTVRGGAPFGVATQAAELALQLQQVMQSYPSVADQSSSFSATSGDLEAVFERLKEMGEYWFHCLFKSFSAYTGISKDLVGDAREFLLHKLGSPRSLEIVQERVSPSMVPWALLYDERLRGQSSNPWDGFWGFRHVINEVLECNGQFDVLRADPRITAGIDTGKDTDNLHIAPDHPFRTVQDTGRLELLLNGEHFYQRMAAFEADCFYYFGDAVCHSGSALSQQLFINGDRVTLAKVKQLEGPRYTQRTVFAFLNGCNTNQGNLASGEGWLPTLMTTEQGKVHCLATTNEIPWGAAARFSYFFWRAFLTGAGLQPGEPQSAGYAVRAARLAMRDDPSCRNPLGLLYVLYGSASLRIGSGT